MVEAFDMKLTVLEHALEGIASHPFPFDPSNGLTLDAALKIDAPQPPDDFTAFWKALYQRSRNTDTNPMLSAPISEDENQVFYEMGYDSIGGQRIQGWLVVPKKHEPKRAFVFGHGYGGIDGPDGYFPNDAVAIFPCARGLGRSPMLQLKLNRVDLHVLYGIGSRDTYIHGGCVADFWAAASVLEELFPEAAKNMVYSGASFGGGIGTLLLPWDDRFKAASLGVPSFGNYPLRVILESQGSNETIRKRWLREPRILEVLKYFDAATAARFLKIPTLVWVALFDPSVPPPGQFSVANAAVGIREIVVRTAGHFDYAHAEEESHVIEERKVAFFDEHVFTDLRSP